ncbi:cytochrome c oxidase assembly protein [Thermocrispum agreste]
MAAVAVAATVGYLRGAAQLRDRGDEWPRWHSGEFADGTFVLAAALVARPPEGSFATSTAQHVVVAMVASLLVLARPVTPHVARGVGRNPEADARRGPVSPNGRPPVPARGRCVGHRRLVTAVSDIAEWSRAP